MTFGVTLAVGAAVLGGVVAAVADKPAVTFASTGAPSTTVKSSSSGHGVSAVKATYARDLEPLRIGEETKDAEQ